MYATEGTQRPSNSSNPNPNSDDHKDLTPQVSCPGEEHRLPATGYEQDKEEEALTGTATMSSDYHSEEVELEDLRAFERRMEELADANKPRPVRWHLVLGTIFACTAISACHWIVDRRDSESLVLRLLASRGALAISLATLVMMLLYGVKEVTRPYPSESVQGTRKVLSIFHMNCDNDGRLTRTAPMPKDTVERTPSAHSRSSHFMH